MIKLTDNAVSKTINMRVGAARRDVAAAFMLAYDMRCKGITVFRSSVLPIRIRNRGPHSPY